MLNIEVDLIQFISIDHRTPPNDDQYTLLVILGPRVSRLASSAWTSAKPTAKTKKMDRKRLLNCIVNYRCTGWIQWEVGEGGTARGGQLAI